MSSALSCDVKTVIAIAIPIGMLVTQFILFFKLPQAPPPNSGHSLMHGGIHAVPL